MQITSPPKVTHLFSFFMLTICGVLVLRASNPRSTEKKKTNKKNTAILCNNPAVYISYKAGHSLTILFCEALYNQIQKGCVRPQCLASASVLVPYHWRPTPLYPKGPPPMGPHPGGSGRRGGTDQLAPVSSQFLEIPA